MSTLTKFLFILKVAILYENMFLSFCMDTFYIFGGISLKSHQTQQVRQKRVKLFPRKKKTFAFASILHFGYICLKKYTFLLLLLVNYKFQ